MTFAPQRPTDGVVDGDRGGGHYAVIHQKSTLLSIPAVPDVTTAGPGAAPTKMNGCVTSAVGRAGQTPTASLRTIVGTPLAVVPIAGAGT